MSGIWKKLLLVVGVGTLILIGSSVGSAFITQTGIGDALTPDSLEWRGFYSSHNPATLEGGFHWWPISTSNQEPARGRPLPVFDNSYWEEQRRRDQDSWQRQQELDGLRRDFEWQRQEDQWQRQQELDSLRRDFDRQRQEDKWQHDSNRGSFGIYP